MKEKPACSIDECERPHYARGWCNAHYYRFWKYGDPTLGGTVKGDPERFVQQVLEKPYPTECILWPFHVHPNGYGRIQWHGKQRNVSRVVCELAHGAPPSQRYQAAHAPVICHNTACINPRHLRWATVSENVADKKLDGTHYNSGFRKKLTIEQVTAIRSDPRSHKEIAADYSVHRSTIGRIKKGLIWNY